MSLKALPIAAALSLAAAARAAVAQGQHNVVMLLAEGSRSPAELKNEQGRSMQTSGRITWR
jgi:hypothetical protein